MVSGHDDLGLREPREEVAGLPELDATRALGQVAGNHDDVGMDRLRRRGQRVELRAIDAAEVQVGKVHHDLHGASPFLFSRGTTTRSVFGRTR